MIEQAARQDPSIYNALVQTEEIRDLLSTALILPPDSLLPDQRQAIFDQLKIFQQLNPVPVPPVEPAVAQVEPVEPTLHEHPRTEAATIENTINLPAAKPVPTRSWKIPLAIAAVLGVGVFVIFQIPLSEDAPVAKNDSESAPQEWKVVPLPVTLALPAPGPPGPAIARRMNGRTLKAASPSAAPQVAQVDEILKRSPIPSAAELPPISPRESVLAAEFPSLPLPVQSGTASLGWIAQSIRGEGKLPAPDAVRIEEILNSFPIKPIGTAAISRGVTLSTETLPCPWKPSATLLIVSLRGAVNDDREVETYFQANPESVIRYRLIGFAPVAGAEPQNLPRNVAAKSLTTLAIEIEPKGAATDFGTIQWSVNGEPAAPISLIRKTDAEPSDDSRFAALLCTYGQWLSGDQSGIIDAEILAALAREISSTELAPERHDLLTLIDQSLNL